MTAHGWLVCKTGLAMCVHHSSGGAANHQNALLLLLLLYPAREQRLGWSKTKDPVANAGCLTARPHDAPPNCQHRITACMIRGRDRIEGSVVLRGKATFVGCCNTVAFHNGVCHNAVQAVCMHIHA